MNLTTHEIFIALKRPFPENAVSWRVGSTTADKKKGIALAYIDARDVMKRLDDVFGINWQTCYPHAEAKTICEIGCKVDGEWIWKSSGAGDTEFEAEKGAISDAFKRAAVLWGIGRYLYDLGQTWVDLDDKKRIIKNPPLPKWATPQGYDALLKEQAYLDDIAEKVIQFRNDPEAAVALIETYRLDDEEKISLWFRFDSTFRSAMKSIKKEK